MAEDGLQLPSDQSLDYHIISLFQRLESMRKENGSMSKCFGSNPPGNGHSKKYNMHAEIRTLEFWR